MHIGNPRDFLAGILFMFFGAAAMLLSTDYLIGSAARMGPGYFPFALGGFLAVLGLVILLKSLQRTPGGRTAWPVVHFMPLVLVLSSVVLFGLLLLPLGLLAATFILVIVCSRASHEFRWQEALLNAAVLILIVLVVFVYFLKFQVPVWPSFITGRG